MPKERTVPGQPPNDGERTLRLEPPVVVLTGAGVSTDSGIPDFRGKDGLWQRFDPMLFTLQRFLEDPDGFWKERARLIAALDHLDARPNAVHVALAQAAASGDVACIVTQNIDGLHRAAGTPEDRLIEVHGNGRWCRCLSCGARPETTQVLGGAHAPAAGQPAAHVGAEPQRAPRCACGGLLKPDVVLFGEPVARLGEAVRAVEGCKTLVALGTSLQVHPVAGLVPLAQQLGCQVVVANREATPFDDGSQVLRGGVAQAAADLWPRAWADAQSSAGHPGAAPASPRGRPA